MSYGGVPGHRDVDWSGRQRVPTLDVPSVDRMAEKAIERAAHGYKVQIAKQGATRRVVSVRRSHNDPVVACFSFEAKRGGVVAVRLRRLIDEGVPPAQWVEHMPGYIQPEQHITWTTGGGDE